MAALTMQSLKEYVGGGRRAVPVGTLLLDLTHNLLASRFVEIPFGVADSISSVKAKVYSMTGSSEQHMRLLLNGSIEMREEDNKLLGEYGAQSGDFIHVLDEDPFSTCRNGAFDDLSQVKKFELTEEEYDKRDNTYRAYKRKMLAADPNWKSIYQQQSEARQAAMREAKRAAGYPEDVYETPESIHARIKVGQRCIVAPGDRRGEVKYVGLVPELPNYEMVGAPGSEAKAAVEEAAAAGMEASAEDTAAAAAPAPDCIWIGVQLDEPTGKHDGIVKGKRYFQANHHAAIFAKPAAVKTGDYPEVDPFASSDEEEEEEEEDKPKGQDIYEEL